MPIITLALSLTALLFAISGFVLGLLGFIHARAAAQSTHTVQFQPQEDLSSAMDFAPPAVPEDHTMTIPNEDVEEFLLKGL